MAMHPVVNAVTTTYLSAVDAALPGFLEGLYLTGSVALDDFYPRRSDIDFLAVSSTPPSSEQVMLIEQVHRLVARRHPRPTFDGIYVTWDELAAPPEEAEPGPQYQDGTFRPHVRNERHPVIWNVLACHGIALRGPRPRDLKVDTTPWRLDRWTRGNLELYWRPWWKRGSRLLSRPGLANLTSWGPQWGVLGVSRLHYTLTTGKITSKRGAGEYARTTFDAQWRRIVDECLRIRTGAKGKSLYSDPFTRRIEALDFLDMAIDHANQLPRYWD
jgi:hypothetical protein